MQLPCQITADEPEPVTPWQILSSVSTALLVATLSRNAYARYSMRHEIADVSSLELTENIIRTRAYHFYEERGYEDGHDLEDWLRAWREIIGKKPAVADKDRSCNGNHCC